MTSAGGTGWISKSARWLRLCTPTRTRRLPAYVINSLPARLYKAFTEIEHATALVEKGMVRLRRIDQFREAGDGRADSTEGTSHLLIPGDVPVVTMERSTGKITNESTQPGHFNYSGSFLNPTYLFCTSDGSVAPSFLETRFGPYVVEIYDTAKFVESLQRALETLFLPDDRQVLFLDGGLVRYDKGSVGKHPDTAEERLRLEFTQKPEQFRDEKEYRLAVVMSGMIVDSPTHVDLCLHDTQGFARITS